MATPQSQPPPTQTGQLAQAQPTHARSPDVLHYASWAVVILGPIALFTPPRRVGLQAVLIATGTSYATNILMYDYTGESIYQRFVRRFQSIPTTYDGLPEKAKRTQELMRLERERREAQLPKAERRRLQEEREKKELAQRSLWEKIWMGNEKGNWKEERAKKDKEALEEGKGYGDLIVDQVKEVFSSKKEEDDKRKAEEDENKKS
ncbi:hypothetical protein N0V82_001565 [Gnomoniopsis sp. IMI 355080]|nr:hypothetical protein N0V82_001565 [Gnomoniopsis sp. IMI 355080]